MYLAKNLPLYVFAFLCVSARICWMYNDQQSAAVCACDRERVPAHICRELASVGRCRYHWERVLIYEKMCHLAGNKSSPSPAP